MLRKTWVIGLILAALLSACSGGAAPQPVTPAAQAGMEDAMETEMAATATLMGAGMETPMPGPETETMATEAMMEDAMGTPDPMLPETGGETPMMETPAWYAATLSDVRTGEAFTVQDFEGKVVLVETMAVWCPTCRQQQEAIQALHEQLGMREDFVSLSLDIDPNEDESDLKAYLEQHGFDWTYAIAPAEVAGEIGRLYGDQFLNPPSAPVLIIDRQGAAHPLPFGLKSSAELLEAVNKYLDAM